MEKKYQMALEVWKKTTVWENLHLIIFKTFYINFIFILSYF